MHCEFVDPLSDPQWNNRVLEFANSTVFHSSAWARVLADAYQFSPRYALLTDEGRCMGILPLMDIKSIWTGRRGICLPFTDECGALARDTFSINRLIRFAQDQGLKLGWEFLEVREDCSVIPEAILVDQFWRHHLQLLPDADLQIRQLKESNRRNIQNARKSGLEIHHMESREAMQVFYRLHCRTRRRHGIPPQPLRFFRLIQKHLVEQGFGFFTLARFENEWIAGALLLRFGSRAIYKFGASNESYLQYRPNNLVIWEAICRLRELGVQELSFGRTSPGNEGLLQFKRGWGAEETQLPYFRIGVGREITGRSARSTGKAPLSNVVQHLPIPLLRLVGSLVYRHMA